jgi:predicted dehydrogenase
MTKILKAGLIGCGDFLRWEIEKLNASKLLKIKWTFDLNRNKAENRARQLGATVANSEEEIFSDSEVDVVMIFTPPFARLNLFERAARNGKHIITTKPFAPNLIEADKLRLIIENAGIRCSVFYGRTGNDSVETMKQVFESGEIGHLALYKEDWFHHYPQWNDWATDPARNGGPFMDAMVHNLNKARYLINQKVIDVKYSSENFAQKLKCSDTEFMQVYFENGACSHLFISWAANLEVYSLDGNDREHYGISHYITNKGWYVKETSDQNGNPIIRAHNEKEVKIWQVKTAAFTPYDEVAQCIAENKPFNSEYAMAYEDIAIMDKAFHLVKR